MIKCTSTFFLNACQFANQITSIYLHNFYWLHNFNVNLFSTFVILSNLPFSVNRLLFLIWGVEELESIPVIKGWEAELHLTMGLPHTHCFESLFNQNTWRNSKHSPGDHPKLHIIPQNYHSVSFLHLWSKNNVQTCTFIVYVAPM